MTLTANKRVLALLWFQKARQYIEYSFSWNNRSLARLLTFVSSRNRVGFIKSPSWDRLHEITKRFWSEQGRESFPSAARSESRPLEASERVGGRGERDPDSVQTVSADETIFAHANQSSLISTRIVLVFIHRIYHVSSVQESTRVKICIFFVKIWLWYKTYSFKGQGLDENQRDYRYLQKKNLSPIPYI